MLKPQEALDDMRHILFFIFAFLAIQMLHAVEPGPLSANDIVQDLVKTDPAAAGFFLVEAIFKRDTTTIDRLFKLGLDPDCTFEKFPIGNSPREKHAMLGLGIGSVTPLLAASIYDDPEICRHLIEKGADPNKASPTKDRNDHLWTPLTVACLINSPELVRALIESGADPKIRDSKGRGLAYYGLVMGKNYNNEPRDQLTTLLKNYETGDAD